MKYNIVCICCKIPGCICMSYIGDIKDIGDIGDSVIRGRKVNLNFSGAVKHVTEVSEVSALHYYSTTGVWPKWEE